VYQVLAESASHGSACGQRTRSAFCLKRERTSSTFFVVATNGVDCAAAGAATYPTVDFDDPHASPSRRKRGNPQRRCGRSWGSISKIASQISSITAPLHSRVYTDR